SWHAPRIVAGCYRESTGDSGSTGLLPAYFEISAYHTRAVIHDVQPHACVRPKREFDSDPVISYYQRSFPLARKKTDQNVSGPAMLDRVVHRLLGNMIKMRSRGGVVDQDRGLALKPAVNTE